MNEEIRNEILRFSLSGVLVNATDIGGYFLLIRVLPTAAAKAISFTAAGVVGYLLNKYWTFKAGGPSLAQAVRYFVLNGAALGLNVLINQGFLTVWPGQIYGALTAATLLTGLFIYVGLKRWVFVR